MSSAIRYHDLYPFGSPMPTRVWSSTACRYGFNGKEKDNEINVDGGDYDFGARIYDSRLGRWLSIDFIAKHFPWYSPYQYAGNDAIRCIDMDGLERLEVTIHDNPDQPSISQATIDITLTYTSVTSGRGAISGLDPQLFHDKYAQGNRNGLLFSSLPTATSPGTLITGREYRWAKKALKGSTKHLERLKGVGIDHIYVTDVQYNYTLKTDPGVTLEMVMSWANTDNIGRGVIMEAIPSEQMLPTDGDVLNKFMRLANIEFATVGKDGEVTEGAAYCSGLSINVNNQPTPLVDNYIVLSSIPPLNTSKTASAVHEGGHNSASLHMHGTGNYEYDQIGLQSNEESVQPSIQNTLNIINDPLNRKNSIINRITIKNTREL